MNKDKAFSKTTFYSLLIISIATAAAYVNSFGASFHFDDFYNIVNNDMIRDPRNIPDYFINIQGALSNRPLTLATFALNFHIGELNPYGYHLANTLLHIINSCLLFILIKNIQQISININRGASSQLIPLVSALMFALHPIQTEAVTYIISRSMLLAALFGFLCFILYIKAARKMERRFLYAFALLLISFAGVSSREDYIVVPALIVLFDYYYLSGRRLGKIRPKAILLLSMFLPYIYLYFVVTSTDTFNTSAGFSVLAFTPLEYLATQVHAHMTYLKLLMLPIGLNVDYHYDLVSGMPNLLPLVTYLAIWASGIFLLVRKTNIAGFCILWFMVALTPSSSFVPLVDFVFEHRLYMASAGVFPLFAWLLVAAFNRTASPKAVIYATVTALVIVLSILTVNRNTVWKDEVTLWTDVTRKSPNKARGFNELGIAYLNEQQYTNAEVSLKKAIRLKPDYDLAHMNLSAVYLMQENTGGAADACIRAMFLNTDLVFRCITLGRGIMNISGGNDEAKKNDAQRIFTAAEKVLSSTKN